MGAKTVLSVLIPGSVPAAEVVRQSDVHGIRILYALARTYGTEEVQIVVRVVG